MKKLKFNIFVVMLVFLTSALWGQEGPLKIEFIKSDNNYLKTLPDGKKECAFFIDGIKSQKQAEALQNYIKGYRGVEQFNLTKDVDGKYKASGIFYSFANASYFKYLFQLIKVEKIFINNQWINIEQFNTLQL
ncbi:MAG: hypothetical protein N2449_01285 [Bacteroidales bacterium]|nr:hypothetical protein [Bacteroidales bacterium]